MSKEKNILIISYYFGPRNVIGAIRATKIAKYLQRDEYNVDVIALECDEKNEDEILKKDVENINIFYLKHSKSYTFFKNNILDKYIQKRNSISKETNINKSTSANTNYKLKTIINFVLSIYQSIDFKNKSKKIIRKLLKEKKYSNVYCTYGPLPSLFSIKWMMKNYKNESYIVDFRDPVTINGSKSIRWMTYYFNKLVKYIVNRSQYSIGVTKGISNYIKDITGKNSITIYNGFDKEDIKDIIISKNGDKKIRFSYAGGLYRGRRSLLVLFKAINQLINENIINIDDIVLEYAGSEINELLFQAGQYNLKDIIIYRGTLAKKDALIMQMKSDFCIVCTWNNKDDLGVIPGKLYETMMFENQVIGIVCGSEKNSELKEIINNNNLGFCYEEADTQSYNELYDYLLSLVKENRKSSKYVEEFDYINITKKYEQIFKRYKLQKEQE